MEDQFEHDLYNKFFSIQLESDKTFTLQQRIKWWMMFVDRGGPIPSAVYDFSFEDLFGLYRKSIDPEWQELVTLLRMTDYPIKNEQKIQV